MTKKIRVNMVSETEFTVQGHGVHTAYVEMARALKKRSDVDLVINVDRPADITHIQTMGTYALRRLLKGPGKKVISGHLVPDSFIGSLAMAHIWRPFAVRYMRWFYNHADLILAVSDDTKNDLLSIGVTKPMEVFYNIIDTSQYESTPADRHQARRKLKIDDDAFVVIGAGQVQPRKRVDSFIELARKLPDVKFIWVGGMPFGKVAADHEKMKRMIESAPANVTMTGIVPLADMRRYYQAANAFILPSEQETFGLVVVEAAATGLPVILRDIPDYDETFKGFAIQVDERKFVAEIKKLRQDKSYYAQAQAKAKQLAAKFDSKAGAERLVKLYRQLANK